MKTFRIAVAMLGLLIGVGFPVSVSFGKAEYTKKEGKPCTYCHVKAGSKELNDVGKCYEKNKHSLEGCAAKEEPKEKK